MIPAKLNMNRALPERIKNGRWIYGKEIREKSVSDVHSGLVYIEIVSERLCNYSTTFRCLVSNKKAERAVHITYTSTKLVLEEHHIPDIIN